MKLLKQQEGSENENTVYISVKGFSTSARII